MNIEENRQALTERLRREFREQWQKEREARLQRMSELELEGEELRRAVQRLVHRHPDLPPLVLGTPLSRDVRRTAEETLRNLNLVDSRSHLTARAVDTNRLESPPIVEHASAR